MKHLILILTLLAATPSFGAEGENFDFPCRDDRTWQDRFASFAGGFFQVQSRNNTFDKVTQVWSGKLSTEGAAKRKFREVKKTIQEHPELKKYVQVKDLLLIRRGSQFYIIDDSCVSNSGIIGAISHSIGTNLSGPAAGLKMKYVKTTGAKNINQTTNSTSWDRAKDKTNYYEIDRGNASR